MELVDLKGVGEKTAALFAKLNIRTTRELISFYPRSYDYFGKDTVLREAQAGQVCSVRAAVAGGSFSNKRVKNLSIQSFAAKDQNGDALRCSFFNMPYLKGTVREGAVYVFRGTLLQKGSALCMDHPKMYKPEEYELLRETLQPIYPLTKGLTNTTMKKTMEKALAAEREAMQDDMLAFCFPEGRIQESYGWAVRQIHFPDTYELLTKARERLVYQEFFLFLLKMRLLQSHEERAANLYPMMETAQPMRLLEKLPYRLTGDQQTVLREIFDDLTGPAVMSRLVQGDVGSGKTILAFLSMLLAVNNGYQAAMMAPTEVLAVQHFESFEEMNRRYGLGLKISLLTGSVPARQKKEIYASLASGGADICVGTHALIQEGVDFRDLALVITDEQHRFGVKQRWKLSDKGRMPHILVMSATPIPRTLAMILYGDMDISVIRQMPKGRKPIKNCVVHTGYRQKAYRFITEQVKAGHQAYIICPMVEEGEMEDLENVADYARKLKKELPETVRVASLHGKMKAAEKNRIMAEYAEGKTDVLVSTTVVEVGVNVPNATVMMIENAERFGLAQLHQLRGRVGRGSAQSYCIFMSGSGKEEAMERLRVLEQSNDGFEIAGEDMKRRGPGDLFGFRQSGELAFVLGDVYKDADLLKRAEHDVACLLQKDPEMARPEHRKLRDYTVPDPENAVDFRTI